ncbi:MAG: metal-sulfur cluster assembly factor [Tumebacillaceae bacterium]
MITPEDVRECLLDVLDPELMMDVVNLGLIYDIQVQDGTRVEIVMTLTTMGCPAGDSIRQEMIEKVQELPGVQDVQVAVTFDPPWSKEMMSDEARTIFRYLF